MREGLANELVNDRELTAFVQEVASDPKNLSLQDLVRLRRQLWGRNRSRERLRPKNTYPHKTRYHVPNDPLPPFLEPPKERGFLAEYLFIQAWLQVVSPSGWAVAVRRGRMREDYEEKTDAVLLLHRGSEHVRIQIKSRAIGKEKYDELVRESVVPLVVVVDGLRPHSFLQIRRNTIRAILRYKRRRVRLGYPPRTREVAEW